MTKKKPTIPTPPPAPPAPAPSVSEPAGTRIEEREHTGTTGTYLYGTCPACKTEHLLLGMVDGRAHIQKTLVCGCGTALPYTHEVAHLIASGEGDA